MRRKQLQISSVDQRVFDTLKKLGVNFACSVPCTLLSGILEELSQNAQMIHVPVTREEEGVGICAGAYLAGARPVLVIQNSGLGNSLNALLSLTKFYQLGLLLLIGYRGRVGEERVAAQIPMGKATEKILRIAGAETCIIEEPADIDEIRRLALDAYEKGRITAALLTPRLWSGEKGRKSH